MYNYEDLSLMYFIFDMGKCPVVIIVTTIFPSLAFYAHCTEALFQELYLLPC